MSSANPSDRGAALRQVRQVMERLVRDGTVVARSDGTVHRLVPLAVSPAEGRALRGWVAHEDATRTIEIGLGYGISALFVCEGRRFELAFVDGNHRFDAVFLDLIYLGRLLHPGAIVFLDDYQLPSVARAASFCLTNLGWTLEEVSPLDALHQWAVLRTSEIADMRPFDHYVDF